jgi:hypothetical protein
MKLLGDVGHLESRFSPFRDGVSVGARSCMVCARRTIGSEIILDTPDGTPRRRGSIEARFGSFRDSANMDARSLHGFRRTYHRPRNFFGRTRWNS